MLYSVLKSLSVLQNSLFGPSQFTHYHQPYGNMWCISPPFQPLCTPAVHLPTSVPPENRSAVCTLTAILEQVPVLNQCQLEDVWRIGRATFRLWEGSWRREVYCGVSRRDWWKHEAIMHKRREIMEQPQRHNYQNSLIFFFFGLLNVWYFEIPIFDTGVLNSFKKETLLIQTNIIEDLF